MGGRKEPEDGELRRGLQSLLQQVEDWLELPMIVLAFVWLILLIIELIWGLVPILQGVVNGIWIIFVVDFLLRFILAPRKLNYLRSNWLTAISLALPALRLFRIVQVVRILWLARAARGVRLVRIVSSLNRGMGALRARLGRRQMGYVVAFTLIIMLVGAASMYQFERSPTGDRYFTNYGDALWWTAMILTTLGSEFWPKTAEGRILCVLLSTYSLAVLGYIAGSLASLFIGQDAKEPSPDLPSAQAIEELRQQIEALRAEIHQQSGHG
jgi:voltage-gated potassium channel